MIGREWIGGWTDFSPGARACLDCAWHLHRPVSIGVQRRRRPPLRFGHDGIGQARVPPEGCRDQLGDLVHRPGEPAPGARRDGGGRDVDHGVHDLGVQIVVERRKELARAARLVVLHVDEVVHVPVPELVRLVERLPKVVARSEPIPEPPPGSIGAEVSLVICPLPREELKHLGSRQSRAAGAPVITASPWAHARPDELAAEQDGCVGVRKTQCLEVLPGALVCPARDGDRRTPAVDRVAANKLNLNTFDVLTTVAHFDLHPSLRKLTHNWVFNWPITPPRKPESVS